MSGISTKKREHVESAELQVGYDSFNIIALNPERDELNTLLGTEKTDELEYLSEDDDGKAKLRLTFWLENIKTKWKQSVSFWVTDKPKVKKEDPDKKQWVNQSGKTTWGYDEDTLVTWFKHFMKNDKPIADQLVRVAYDGEENLVNFLSAWLDTDRKEGTGILPDYKQLFKGNVKELRGLIGSEVVNPVIVSVGVKTKEVDVLDKEGTPTGEKEKREYQSVFNKAFLPGQLMKNLRIGSGDKYVKSQLKTFKEKHEGDHGFKDFYIFQEAKAYNPEQNLASTEGNDVSENGPDYN